jgi:hypothetical protein
LSSLIAVRFAWIAPMTPLPAQHLAARLNVLQFEHHAALAAIKLASFATDSLRLHDRLREHANGSPALDAQLRTICPDWRDLGMSVTDDPEALIVLLLNNATVSLQDLFAELTCLADQALALSPAT